MDIKELRHGLYPVHVANQDGSYDITFEDAIRQIDGLSDFMANGEMGVNGGYAPLMDPSGPMTFFPLHCAEIKSKGIYASPVIAYIEEDNEMQEKLVAQVISHFSGLSNLLKTLASDAFVMSMVNDGLDVIKQHPYLNHVESMLRIYDQQFNLWAGEDRSVGKLEFPDMTFVSKKFKSKEELDAYIAHPDYGFDTENRPGVCFAFRLKEFDKVKKNDYELELFFNDAIVLDYRSIPPQDEPAINDFTMTPMLRSYAYYSFYGFAYLQNWAANTILRSLTGMEDAQIASMTVPMRLTPAWEDRMAALLYFCLHYFLMLMFIPMVYRVTYRLVKEKELGTKDMMHMMGMSKCSYWLSWAAYFTILNTFLSTAAWFVLCFFVMRHTSGTVLWFQLWLFGMSIFGYIMFFQSFFTTARIGAVATTVIYFGSAITLQIPEHAPTWQKILVSIFPTGCMTQISKVICGYQLHGMGIEMHNLDRDYKGFNCRLGFTIHILFFIVANLLGMYFENVVPKKYGKSYSCCFCLKKSYWCKNNNLNPAKFADSSKEANKANFVKNTCRFETSNMNKECYEKVSVGFAQFESDNRFMKITNLCKTYANKVRAVNGINVKMYADQIFVLLGHNGAGKTSVISILTGLYNPSEGQAEVFGHDIFNDFDSVRQFIGICPQHDIFFDLLTPREHLEIFYDFKGGDPNPKLKEQEISKLLLDVDLDKSSHIMTSKLSGGNQRKLSNCMSFVGGSKLIIMDEPTSSLDLSARRKIWTMLKEYKKDRIILLTTHYMDEADILGDRIGVMTQGKITCLGSSLFLKQKFGVGYNLTMVKMNLEENQKVLKFCKDRLGQNVKRVSEIQNELTIQVPNEYTDKFSTFFEAFEKQLFTLGIESYGITLSTLEDVFLKIGHSLDPIAALKENKELPATKVIQRAQISYEDQETHRQQFIEEQPRHLILDQSLSLLDLGQQRLPPIFEQARQTARQISPKKTVQEEILEGGESEEEEKKEFKRVQIKRVSNRPLFQIEPFCGDEQKNVSNQKINQLSQDQNETQAVTMKDMTNASNLDTHVQIARVELENNKFVLGPKIHSSFGRNFKAIVWKRILLYQSISSLFNEILVPFIIMFGGVSLVSIDFFTRTESSLLTIDRLMPHRDPASILVNTQFDRPGNNFTVETFIDALPQRESYDVRYTNRTMNFTEFYDYMYWYGQGSYPEFPFFYGAYQLYEMNRDTHQYKFYTFGNLTNAEFVATYPQYMYESIFKVAMEDDDFQFKVRNTPFPITNEVKNRRLMGNSVSVIFMCGVTYSMLSASIIGHVIGERVGGIKHSQLISGMHLGAYWLGNFVVDVIKMYIVVIASVAAFFAWDLKYHYSWIVYLIIPFSVVPFLYSISFLFQSVSAGQTGIMFFTFGLSVFGSTLISYLRFLAQFEMYGDPIHYWMRVFPAYTIGSVVYYDSQFSQLEEFRRTTDGTGENLPTEPWTWRNIVGDIVAMFFSFVFWSLILILIENGAFTFVKTRYRRCCFRNSGFQIPQGQKEIDKDVLEEQERIKAFSNEEFSVKVKQLKKVYMTGSGGCNPGQLLKAVENLSFGLQKGECLALLGVNGAGKSTTFKTLVAEEKPSHGKVTVQGLDINKQFQKARKLLGYCPQYNPIFDNLSVEQNLLYFAELKGIPTKIQSKMINDAVERLGLTVHIKKAAGTLSGGNKRKLSVAIAILGNPPIILLDEPSAGMDPEARRFMWQVVSELALDKTSAVILTTHSMDEAEALSTKMGIMVKGGIFKCYGSSQHIKNKFGVGYEITIKIGNPTHEEVESLIADELCNYLTYNRQIIIQQALQGLIQRKLIDINVAEQIKQELVSAFKMQTSGVAISQIAFDIETQVDLPVTKEKEVTCSAQIFAEKLYIQKYLLGCLKEIGKHFTNIELLEQYDSYMRVRVPKEQKTIGQMFSLVQTIQDKFNIDQYSVNQTTLEQIFQSFANLSFDQGVKKFSVQNNQLKQTKE